MRAMITAFAPAKVNLFLHVTGKRPDGYHLLDSLAVFPAIGDEISVAPADVLSLRVVGDFGGGLAAEPDNLVLQAARALAAAAGVPPRAAIMLRKNLPVASGIGGGSADAAAALRALSGLWGLTLPLAGIAPGLGADVPVCVASVAARMGGAGESLGAAPALPRIGIVLVNPGVPVATAAVFRARRAGFSPAAALPAAWPDAAAMARDLAALRNDLAAPALAIAPVIGEVLDVLRRVPGVLLARMSGSGATCFALFATPEAARAAVEGLQRPGWWVRGGGLYEPAPPDL